MPKKDDDQSYLKDIPHERTEPRPDFSAPLPRSRLPAALQDTLDNEEKLWETLYEGKSVQTLRSCAAYCSQLTTHDRTAPSTESDIRYAAYATRIRTILLSAHRYVAYTSDVGESFRPIAHPILIRGAYAISWAYLIGDVSHEGYKAYLQNQRTVAGEDISATHVQAKKDTTVASMATPEPSLAAGAVAATKDLIRPGVVAPIDDYRTVMVQRAIFQSIASMGLPAFTIHSIVKYSGRAFRNAANKNIRTWAPIGLGLAAVPALPYMFDKPVEEAVEWTFHKGFEMAGFKHTASHDAINKKEL